MIQRQIDHLQRHPNLCGSGLAREGGGRFKIIIAWHSAFASKPAPTMIRRPIDHLQRHPNLCGSGLAREGGCTFKIIFA